MEGTVLQIYLMVFFANKIVLVEGPTEEYALPIYLDAVGYDTLENGVAVISVGGKGNLAKWWRFFSAYQIPTFVCFDNDAKKDNDGTKRKDALKAIGIPELELNNILSTSDWNVNDRFCVFGSDFEDTFRASFIDYSSIEKEEIFRLGASKPIIARAVARKIVSSEIKEEDTGWSWLIQVSEKLKGLN